MDKEAQYLLQLLGSNTTRTFVSLHVSNTLKVNFPCMLLFMHSLSSCFHPRNLHSLKYNRPVFAYLRHFSKSLDDPFYRIIQLQQGKLISEIECFVHCSVKAHLYLAPTDNWRCFGLHDVYFHAFKYISCVLSQFLEILKFEKMSLIFQ